VRHAGLDHPQLVKALLHAVREHDWNRQAAVRLLVEHGVWPRRRSFWEHVDIDSDFRGHDVAWGEFGELAAMVVRSPASSSEQAILRLACHLAGAVPPRPRDAELWTLAGILLSLDRARAGMAVDAVRHAALGGGGRR
jgi:hypothetical protein